MLSHLKTSTSWFLSNRSPPIFGKPKTHIHKMNLQIWRKILRQKCCRRWNFSIIATIFFLLRKHYLRNKLLTLWKELPRYCSWLFTLEWQRGEKEAGSMRPFYFYSEKGKGTLGGIENAKLDKICSFFLQLSSRVYIGSMWIYYPKC